jgi:hypothetical protein
MDLEKEYIHGDKFRNIAHFIFDENKIIPSNEILKKNSIIFCHTHFVKYIFSLISNSTFKYIIITHNSDFNITEDLYNKKPKNVIKWFSQNVCIEKKDLIPIPIGLERFFIHGKGGSGDIKLIEEESKKDRNFINLVYLNITIGTNKKEREFVYNKFKQYDWVTTENNRIQFDFFAKKVRNHKFVISPPGNGIDCHRTWETLYLGSIPIVKKSPMTEYFLDLPILITDSWNEINEEYLKEKYNDITNKYYNYNKIKMSYWENEIKKSFIEIDI